MQVSYLPDPENHPLWDEIRALLQPATIGSPAYEPGELVWIAFDGPVMFGAGTTALFGDVAEIRACGGHLHKEWVEQAEAAVSAWARQHATKLTMRGRKGWARYLRAFGWALLGEDEDGLTIFEKVL